MSQDSQDLNNRVLQDIITEESPATKPTVTVETEISDTPKTGNAAATGRRKKAVARVRLKEGTGNICVNGRGFCDYFTTLSLQNRVLKPLELIHAVKLFDIDIKTTGGGLNGQASAISLGIARALNIIDENLRAPLKKSGLLTRDPRRRERGKPGRAGARKRFQFSKR